MTVLLSLFTMILSLGTQQVPETVAEEEKAAEPEVKEVYFLHPPL